MARIPARVVPRLEIPLMSRSLRLARPALLLTTVVAVTGCGTHTAATPHSTVTVTQYATNGTNRDGNNSTSINGNTPDESTDGTASPGITGNTSTSSDETSVVDPALYSANGGGYGFSSPTGNLLCQISTDGPSCTSMHTVTNLADCNHNPGSQSSQPIVSIENHRVQAGCASDPGFSSNTRALPYGTQLNANGYTCTSHTSGIRCTDHTTGATFTASRSYFGPAS